MLSIESQSTVPSMKGTVNYKNVTSEDIQTPSTSKIIKMHLSCNMYIPVDR